MAQRFITHKFSFDNFSDDDTAHARAETWKEAAHEVQNHMERRAADPEYRDEIPKDILDLFTSELGYPRH